MTAHTRQALEDMLEDVVNELDLSDDTIKAYGESGECSPAKMVRLILQEKDKQITMLKAGMKQIEIPQKTSTAIKSIDLSLVMLSRFDKEIETICSEEVPFQCELDKYKRLRKAMESAISCQKISGA